RVEGVPAGQLARSNRRMRALARTTVAEGVEGAVRGQQMLFHFHTLVARATIADGVEVTVRNAQMWFHFHAVPFGRTILGARCGLPPRTEFKEVRDQNEERSMSFEDVFIDTRKGPPIRPFSNPLTNRPKKANVRAEVEVSTEEVIGVIPGGAAKW